MFHNNLWQCPMPVRLIAVSTTHVQMWRHLTPERLVSFSSYAVSLQTVHDVDYWATDAIPEDSRFYWKSFFRYSGKFRAEPLFMPVYGDAVRAPIVSAQPGPAVHPDPALGLGRDGHPVLHRQRPPPPGDPAPRSGSPGCFCLWVGPHQLGRRAVHPRLRARRCRWSSTRSFRPTTLGQQLPVYAAWLLTGALASLIVLIFIEDQLAPPRPQEWGIADEAWCRGCSGSACRSWA